MAEARVERRLTAIFAGDVAGYSRLMGADEEGTLARLEIQRGMIKRNASVPQDTRIEFRIGIHVGDVIIEDGDMFGDGVNIAARLEGIAQPGGICISDDAYRQVRGKLDVNFQDAGEQELKNIARPVRVYKLSAGGQPTEPTMLTLPDKPSIAVLPFQNLSGDLNKIISPMAWLTTSSRDYRGSSGCSSSLATRPLPIRVELLM
jgi:adenylate cyclase